MIGFIQNVVDALSLGSLYALAALGIGLLFGILRLINLAHGDFITIGAFALIVPSRNETAVMGIGSLPLLFMVLAVCAVVVITALVSDRLVFSPLRRANAPTLMIASSSVSYVIQHSILVIFGARPKGIDLWSALGKSITIGPIHVPQIQLVTIGVTLLLMLALTAFLKRTPYGVQIRAAAEDFQMARYLGVKANIAIGVAFALSGILAAAVSLLYISQTGTLTSALGVPLMLYAFIATVVGGMGSLVGAVVGGFAVGFLAVMLQAYLPDDLRSFRDAFVFGVVILVLLVRPAGIVPTKALAQRV
ncbi:MULTISPECIES: branched-chain amino acid ABC transporter permease [unclassified Bradyrhizobium]|uniref:branched-chain amino acid ABC transporter permease n=1 Tax=unclassified Bradyrhizobium TaxID=2631580 RepID=UPI002478BA23|nr:MULTISPECIES: branched-chain amino acid ABC transporter permease [unclassified Bradyrhizobium]WGS19197.1 branched-chain amino acid ABC transporter permease [Bradyrhizobium sp. ISRA463]WGS26033.1 branched-chain amino acid ABC transporter permease [Bradyrhizobium sp. ISRA464]